MNRQFRRKQNKMNQNNNTAPKNQEELGMLKNQLRNIQGQYVNSYTNVFNNVVNSMLQGQTNLDSEDIIKHAMDLTEKIRITADEYAAKLSKEAKVPSSLLQRIKELEGIEPETAVVKPELKIIDG